jgi:cytoskeletal protein CcmA (bactofilin family)
VEQKTAANSNQIYRLSDWTWRNTGGQVALRHQSADTFSGEIHCSGTVTVGEQGTVRSSISAEEIVIAGKVFGNVSVERRLIMTDTGQLHGDILAGTLSIMEGSVLNGAIAMKEQPAPQQAGGPESHVNTDKTAAKRPSKTQGTLEAG